MDNGQQKNEFNRVLNTLDVLVVAFGAMIGWGWVVASGQWIQTGGVIGAALGFVVGGLMIYFVGLTYAELTTAMPKCGGEQHFSYAAFGPLGSFVCTWALILSYVGVVCFEACSFPTILQYIFPGIQKGYLYTIAGFDVYLSWVLIAVVMAVFITYINIRGTKKAAILQTILTITIAVVGIILIAASAFTGTADNVMQHPFVGEDSSSLLFNILKVAIMTPFFLLGFDVIPQAAEEISVPLKRLGGLMVLSIVLAVAFYALIVLAIGAVMTPNQINASMADSGLVTADAMAVAFGSKAMAKVLILGGLCGIVTSWNSFLIGGSRVMYSMAKSNMIPHRFSKLHSKHKTPIAALLLLGGLSVAAPLLGRAMLVWIVDAANFACCIAYCMVAFSFLFIRKRRPAMARPYRVKNGKLVGFAAVIMSGFMVVMYMIPGTNCALTWQEWLIVGGWALLGLLFGIVSKRHYKDKFATGMDEF
jgi:amino acid transporter